MTCDLQAIRERERDRRLWYQPNPGEPTWTEVGDLLAEVDRLMALVEVERERREATQRNFGNMTESARAWQSEAARLRAAIEQHRHETEQMDGWAGPVEADRRLWAVIDHSES